MNTAILSVLIAGIGMAIALFAGYKFGVWVTVQTMRGMARNKLNDAEFREYERLLGKIYVERDGGT